MKVVVRVEGEAAPLELEREGEAWLVNGRRASVVEVEAGIYSVLLGGRSFEARIEKSGEAWAVTVGGRRYVVEVSDPRRLKRRRDAVYGEGRQRVVSPMPGKVVRVLVAQGDEVEAGEALLVVEAMKMQNELKAPRAGRVALLTAQAGAAVAAGEVLAVIE
jgi:biotin carboxyl carrier protein